MAGKRVKDVSSLLKDVLPDDQEIAAELRAQIQRRHLVRQLATLRNSKKVSQADVASRLNCKQSKISKLENGFDEDMSLKEIGAYADALDFDVEIVMRSKSVTLVDQVKHHAFQMKKCFKRLTDLAKNDELVAKGVADFHLEALFNLANIIRKSAACLPQAEEKRPHIDLSVQEPDGEGEESCNHADADSPTKELALV